MSREQEEVVAFFRGTGTDIECRSLDQILAWDDILMEVCHDYIQWLFPTDEKSKFNSDAPLLTPELQRIFRQDEAMRTNLKRGFKRFMTFLGLALQDSDGSSNGMSIVKADNFDKRKLMCWRGPENHNWRRMSRVLRCLRLVGMKPEQRALFTCLEDIITEFPGMVEDRSVLTWRSEFECQITPHFAAAVLASPNLLSALCEQTFAKYDTNGNGLIEIGEAVSMVSELHVGLGVHPEALDQQKVADSMMQVVTSGEVGALSLEHFKTWFVAQIKDTLTAGDSSKSPELPEMEIINAEYANALLDSPNLLESTCKRFFRKYDTNQNGRLELPEAIVLSRELYQGVGLPAETLDEWHLISSSHQYDKGEKWVELSEEEFPKWFAGALKATLAKTKNRGRRHSE